MSFLGFGKKRTIDFTSSDTPPKITKKEYPMTGDFVDLRSGEKKSDYPKQTSSSSKSPFDFLAVGSSQSTSTNPIAEVSEISELKIKLRNMTTRVEDQCNEIYKLMQRIELMERKLERFGGRS